MLQEKAMLQSAMACKNVIENKRILITGATGFIGGRIIERLFFESQNNEVITLIRDLSRISRIARFNKIKLIKGDILDLEMLTYATKGIDFIFHCAYGNSGDEEYQRKVTVNGTRNICEAATRNGNKLIYLSTISVYGDDPPPLVDENTPFRKSKDIYTKSKIEAEKIVWEYIRKHSLFATIIRPTVVYGPYSPVWTINLINQLKRKNLVLIDHGNGLCNHLYIDNLIDALFLSALSGHSNGQAYNISDGSSVTWSEFCSYYKEMLDELGIETGWISLGKKELLRLAKERNSLYFNIKGIIRILMSNESLNKEMGKYMLIRKSKKMLKKIIQPNVIDSIRRMQETLRINAIKEETLFPFEHPSIRDINFFSSRTIYSIKKAEEELGYKAKIDINKGMYLVKKWYSTLF